MTSQDLNQAEGRRCSQPMLPRWTFALLVAMVLAPFVFEGYVLFQFANVMIFAIVLTGLNILIGYNGQLSLGHGAFFAIGAYCTAICINSFELSYYLLPLLAGGICLVVGYLFGFPALRLEPLYLALATFSLAIVVPQVLRHAALEHYTGGVQGLFLDAIDVPAGLPLSSDQWLLLFTLAYFVPFLLAGYYLVNSRSGRAFVAVRDNPIAAKSMGIDIRRVKTAAFGVSAMYAGVGGALNAILVQYVAPDSFHFFLSISIFVGAVVGGLASIVGPLFGAVFVVYVPVIAEDISQALPWAVYGAIAIVLMHVRPTGIAGLMNDGIAKIRSLRSNPQNP